MAKFSSVTYAVMKAQGVPVLSFLNWGYKWHCQWLSWISPVQIKPRKPKWQWQTHKRRENFHHSLKSSAMVRHKIMNEATRLRVEIKTRTAKQIITTQIISVQSRDGISCAAPAQQGSAELSSPALLHCTQPGNQQSSCPKTQGMARPHTHSLPDLPTPRTIRKQKIIPIPLRNKTLLIDSE